MEHKVLSVFVLLAFATFAFCQDSPVVNTKQGDVQGLVSKTRGGADYYQYWGIPYAKSPERFKAPEPATVPGWEGVRNASFPGSKCTHLNPITQEVVGSEDCLFLNVFTKSTDSSDKKPVIVYIHGGAFTYGSGDAYLGDFIMDEDVVVVTINYRLSSLGFLNVGKNSKDIALGNMGLKDQTMALKWVKDNIEKFGGDPDKVTAYGTSAGAASVTYHMMSPMSQGLIHRGISSSGSPLSPWAFSFKPERYSAELGKRLECPEEKEALLDCLLKKSPEEIIKQSAINWVWPLDPVSAFGPTKDADSSEPFLPDMPWYLFKKGGYNRIPWLTGATEHEGTLFHAGRILNNATLTKQLNDDWNKIAPSTFSYEDLLPEDKYEETAQSIRKFYLSDKAVARGESDDELESLYGDRNFLHGVYTAIKLEAKENREVYPYDFERSDGDHGLARSIIGEGHDEDHKVYHGENMKYVFNGDNFGYSLKEGNADSVEFSKKYIKFLVDFAKNGKPDGKILGDVEVPATSVEEAEGTKPLQWFHINETTEVKDDTHLERMAFWDKIFDPEVVEKALSA